MFFSPFLSHLKSNVTLRENYIQSVYLTMIKVGHETKQKNTFTSEVSILIFKHSSCHGYSDVHATLQQVHWRLTLNFTMLHSSHLKILSIQCDVNLGSTLLYGVGQRLPKGISSL